jgi:hypothetical protein
LGCSSFAVRRAVSLPALLRCKLQRASPAPTAVIDIATGRCETTAKLEAPALEAAFRAKFGQLLASIN